MNALEAAALARTLRRDSAPLKSGGRLRLRADVVGDRIVFSGGPCGEHSLWLDASSPERILAHWEGYITGSGLPLLPLPGDRVEFPSASAWRAGGYRSGVVLSVGPKRARIAFEYGHGGKAETRAPISELRFGQTGGRS